MGEIAARIGRSRPTFDVEAEGGRIVRVEAPPGGPRLVSGRVVRRLDEIRALAVGRSRSEVRTVRGAGANDEEGHRRR